MALAAALEDRAHPEALYVVYMKLAEIHGSHMPDAQLCQLYRDKAQSLQRVLAGVENSADTSPKILNVDTSLLEGRSSADLEDREDTEDQSQCFADTDTIVSQSYSDSVITGSFDTARENISDSSSSTGTYQNPTEGKDSELDSEHSMPSQIPANPNSEFTDARDTDTDDQDEQNTPTEETADPIKADCVKGSVSMNNEKSANKDDAQRHGEGLSDAHNGKADVDT